MTPVRLGRTEAVEWLDITDPDSDVHWRFDATFMKSGWRCIYGAGCKGPFKTIGVAIFVFSCAMTATFGLPVWHAQKGTVALPDYQVVS